MFVGMFVGMAHSTDCEVCFLMRNSVRQIALKHLHRCRRVCGVYAILPGWGPMGDAWGCSTVDLDEPDMAAAFLLKS